MLGEIDKDFYCSCLSYEKATENCHRFKHRDGGLRKCADIQNECKSGRCDNYHRKHPTPEQYKEEHGIKYQDDGAVYYQGGYDNDEIGDEWFAGTLHDAQDFFRNSEGYQWLLVICACTPFGKPPVDWRP